MSLLSNPAGNGQLFIDMQRESAIVLVSPPRDRALNTASTMLPFIWCIFSHEGNRKRERTKRRQGREREERMRRERVLRLHLLFLALFKLAHCHAIVQPPWKREHRVNVTDVSCSNSSYLFKCNTVLSHLGYAIH